MQYNDIVFSLNNTGRGSLKAPVFSEVNEYFRCDK